jgi:hypothetical protein
MLMSGDNKMDASYDKNFNESRKVVFKNLTIRLNLFLFPSVRVGLCFDLTRNSKGQYECMD